MICKNRVSVVIPAYNAQDFIAETLSSILEQSYPAFEIIVVDDGSKDATASIVSAQFKQVILVSQNNGGVSAARNTGIQKATGDLIAFIDADDLWTPDKLQKQISFLDKHPNVGVVISDELHFINDQQITSASYLSQTMFASQLQKEGFVIATPVTWLISQSFVPTSSVLCRASILRNAGLFDTSISICEDREMWLRLALISEMAVIPEVLVKKRQDHGTNISSISRDKLFKSLTYVIERHRRPAFAKIRAEKSDPKAAYALNYQKFANYFWFQGKIPEAKNNYWKLLKLGQWKFVVRFLLCLPGTDFVSRLRKIKHG